MQRPSEGIWLPLAVARRPLLTSAEQGLPEGQEEQQLGPEHGLWRRGHRWTLLLPPLDTGQSCCTCAD